MNRRELIQRVLTGTTFLILSPSILTSCEKSQTLEPDKGTVPSTSKDLKIDLSLPENSALNTAGNSKIVQNIIIANTGKNTFIAVSSICTHEGGTVGYNYSTNNFQCPLHNSVFAATGSVIRGPAAMPLKSYSVSQSGDILTITF